MNAIHSALGTAKSLLPVGTGGPLPVAPKLPDVPSFLKNVSSLLQDLLGQSPQVSKAPESRDSKSSPKPAVEVVRAPRESSESFRRGDDEVVRDREQSQREAERRLREEAPADGVVVPLEQIRRILEGVEQADPTAPAIRDLIQALDELRKRAGLPAMEAPASETLLSPAPEPPPLGEAVAQQGQAVEVPSSDVPEPGLPEVFAPGAAETPDSAPLPSIEELAMMQTAGTDPMSEPAALGAPSTIVETAVSQAFVPHQDLSTPVRSEPTVGGIAESGNVRTGPSSATPAAEADSPEGRAEMVDRIVKAARLTQSRGSARIRISLNPPHLGELKVDLTVRQHVLHGTLQAETVAAKEMLLSNLQQLRDSLAEQGVQVGEFQVQVDPSFQQAMQEESDDGRPRGDAASYGQGLSEEPAGSVQERLRSARIQVLDVVV